ncbi:MAG: restriction endonuclease [Planctomycetes bacterium]|nr:restriction endonuclease [Planctomycetota bacterium]MCB9886689.1 restriction endonuclease [Planctomycetota bacterium]
MARGEPKLVKTTGELQPFREDKLRRSLARSGASRQQIDDVVEAVLARLRDGMATTEIYRIAHRLLRHERRDTAARYSLQRAIQRLGPDGFPFEEFLAELWRHEGFSTRTGVLMQGRFVRHEVDLVGTRGNEKRLGECKFKAQSDGKVDVKVALYVHARAADLKATGFRRFWLITNGRFTKDALAYGEGSGLMMLSWDHPKGDGLRDRVDRAGLHPVTALSSLHKQEQVNLLRKGVVLCQTLRARPGLVGELGLTPGRTEQLWREIEGLCEGSAD